MVITFKYPIDDNSTNFFSVEADVIEDISCGNRDLDVDFIGVMLNGIMSIKLDQIPDELKLEIEEQARNTWNKFQKQESPKAADRRVEHLLRLEGSEA